MTPQDKPYSAAVIASLLGLCAASAFLWPLGYSAFPPIAGILLIPVFRPLGRSPAFGTLLALMLFGLAATLWSPVFAGAAGLETYDDAEAQTWAKLPLQLGLYAALTGVALGLPERARPMLARIFVVGALGLAALLFMEGAFGTKIYHALTSLVGDPIRPDLQRRNVAQGTYALALMAWPALALLGRWNWRAGAALMVLAAFAAPVLLSAWAPVAAMLAGLAVWLLARRMGPRAGLIVGAGMAAAILLAPWAVLAAEPLLKGAGESMGASWAARLDIWSFTAEQTLRHPLFGWGLDASRAFLPFMLHPHSGPLQIWLELGLAGALLLAGFWFLLARQAAAWGPQALAAATGYFVIGALSFGLWQEWWLGLGAMTVIWAMLARPPESENSVSVIEA